MRNDMSLQWFHRASSVGALCNTLITPDKNIMSTLGMYMVHHLKVDGPTGSHLVVCRRWV